MAPSRGSFDVTDGRFIHEVNPSSALSILNNGNTCPGQLAIYVHGIWANREQAVEQTQRVFLSLQKSGYNIPLIGFSWDSDTPFSLDDLFISQNGWNMAKDIANYNGHILGKFIVDFKKACPNDKVRIIAHSLGARVTLSALQWIDDNYNDGINNNNNTSKMISSVHLLGAAVNNEQVSKNYADCLNFGPSSFPCSGNAIEKVVGQFYNLFDPEDNMLASERIPNISCLWCDDIIIQSPYQYSENNNPLGAYGIESIQNIPSNYHEYNVLSKIIKDDDSDKIDGCDIVVNIHYFWFTSHTINNYCTIAKQGDNHMGYMGYRISSDQQIPVYNSAAIGSVVTDWRNELH